jgi:hypothetical protein
MQSNQATQTKTKKPSKTAMKFLGLAAKVNSWSHKLEGTHIANMKDWWIELEAAGYCEITHTVGAMWCKITPAGRIALDAHIASGGKVAR